MATAAEGPRPAWWPTQTDLCAMVGLVRCDSRRDDQHDDRPADRPPQDHRAPGHVETARGADEPSVAADRAVLAARLSGLLRAGC